MAGNWEQRVVLGQGARPEPPKDAQVALAAAGQVFPDGKSWTERGEALPLLPPAISNVIVVGVGRNDAGTFIDNHSSKQEHGYLSNLAERLQGDYYDGNRKHVPTESFVELTEDLPGLREFQMGLREYAILAIAVGAKW